MDHFDFFGTLLGNVIIIGNGAASFIANFLPSFVPVL
jgi:hypothetical protein